MSIPIISGGSILASDLTSMTNFGGTGADGALTVSSGNTNIDCANAAIVTKNYTSISITGTGSVTFINPATTGTAIFIKVQGNVTLTSSAAPMLNASAMGAAGGTSSSNPYGIIGLIATTSGQSFSNARIGLATNALGSVFNAFLNKYPFVFVGGGGNYGYGSYGSTTGGIGGGALIIQCAGNLNFTTTNGISVAGQVGNNNFSTGGNGGSGGGGGLFILSCFAITANTGTVNINGGGGGTGASSNGATGTSGISSVSLIV